MRRFGQMLAAGLLLILMTGCWDIDRLVNKTIVNGVGVDAAEDGGMRGTISTIKLLNKGGGQFEAQDVVVEATGGSISELASRLNNVMPGKIEGSKTHIIIFGEQMAKKGVMAPLEYFYRNPKTNLNSSFLISEGQASAILNSTKMDTGSPIAFNILQLIEGSKQATISPHQTLFSLWQTSQEEVSDSVIPIINLQADGELAVENVGLMNGDRYSGVKLSAEQSMVLMLMMNRLEKAAVLNVGTESISRPLTFVARKQNNDMSVSIDKASRKVECKLNVRLSGEITSFPITKEGKADPEALKIEVESWLEKQAEDVVAKLRQANSDALGIGRKVKQSDFAFWKETDWKSIYRDVKISVKFDVRTTSTGALY
ncbi:Ger(x)C family spore germination protein [Paenibacillus soyae]|uniref:Ger(X)C family spore germination protein n=1 Tax=Paenibacillus soyae TaxID=2969249 RepID=A0A9X2MPK0_9BACL|nr:Ger(x)C family spore germination protein [Paenibacillus soyae]MCR2803491.1 Ger(x)C family spore germination protein [Paenibacillus soyae]